MRSDEKNRPNPKRAQIKQKSSRSTTATRRPRSNDQTLGRLNLVLSFARELGSETGDVDQILTLTLKWLTKLLDVPRGGAVHPDPIHQTDRALLEYDHITGQSSHRPTVEFGVDSPLQRELSKQHRPVAILDVEADPRLETERKLFIERGIKSSLILPMLAGRSMIGSIGLDSFVRRQFTAEEIDIAFAVASLAATAVRSRRLLDLNKILRESSKDLLKARRLSEALNQVLDSVHKVFGTHCLFALYQYVDKGEKDIIPENFITPPLRSTNLYYPDVPSHRILPDDVAVTVCRQRQPMYVREAQGSSSLLTTPYSPQLRREGLPEKRFVFREGIQSTACVPLIVADVVVGAMFISFRDPHNFDEDERYVIESFASQAATAIASARSVERAFAELEPLGQLGSEIFSGAVGVEEALERIVVRMKEIIEADIAEYLILTGDQLSLGNTTGKKREPGYTLSVRESVTGYAAMHKESILLYDVETDVHPAAKFYKPTIEGPMHSEIAVPLTDKRDNVLGVFNCEKREIKAFDEHHVSLVKSLAGYAVAVIQNARLSNTLLRLGDLQRRSYERLEDLDSVLNKVLHEALDLIGFNSGWLLLRQAGKLVIRVATDSRDVKRTINLDDSVSGLVVTGKEPILSGDVQNDARLKNHYQPPAEPDMISELAVPIKEADEVVGVINVESKLRDAFTEQDMDMLTFVAAQAGSIIRNARVSIEIAELRQIESQILRIGAEVDEQIIFQEILRATLRLIGSNIGQVLLLHGDELIIQATTGKEKVGETKVHIDKSVSGLAIKEHKPVRIDDVRDYKDIYQPILGPEMLSELAIPLEIEDQPIGVLNVESETKAAFTKHDEDLLKSLADRVSLAIQSLRLYSEARALQQIDKAILEKAFDLQAILELILENALRLIGAQFGQVLTVEGNQLAIKFSIQPMSRDMDRVVDIDNSITGLAIKLHKTVNIADVTLPEYSKLYKDYLGKISGQQMHSELVVPMISVERTVGAINIEHIRVGAFKQHDVELLETLASQAALAVLNAEQYEREQNLAVGELAADIVHSLNNPIGGIREWVQRAKNKSLTIIKSDPTISKTFDVIEEGVEQVLTKVDQLDERMRSTLTQSVSMNEVIVEALSSLSTPPNIILDLELDDRSLTVKADKQLSAIFKNLFMNSIEAMPNGGTLRVATHRNEGMAIAEIEDTAGGIPISEDLLNAVFQPYLSGKKAGKLPHGMGLWVVKQYIDWRRGKIDLINRAGIGAKFTVSLPLSDAADLPS